MFSPEASGLVICKEMRNIIIIFAFLIFCISCKKENKIEGFYCLSNHLVYEDSVSKDEQMKRSNNILICIKKDTFYYWGNISKWKKSIKLDIKEFNDTVFIGDNGGYFHQNELCFINNDKSVRKFKKLDVNCKLEAPKEINLNNKNNCVTNEIRRLRRNHVFSGKYKLNGKNVEFFEDGSVKGLYYFSNYDVYFRGGTDFPFIGTNLIKTNNGVWNCKIKGNKYYFSRFEDERNEVDQILMSDTSFELIKS